MNWIEFYNKLDGKKLCAISAKDSFAGEIKLTKGLLSHMHGIKESDIEVKKE